MHSVVIQKRTFLLLILLLFVSAGCSVFRSDDTLSEGGRGDVPPAAELCFRGRILLDPGHGDGDPGAARTLLPEKDLNLALAKKIKTILTLAGYEVFMTRDCDIFVSLRGRQILSELIQPDLFISVHHNSAYSKTASGIETYVRTPEQGVSELCWKNSFAAAGYIQQSLIKKTGAINRGVLHRRFAVLKTSLPSVLVEFGFISNPAEEFKLNTANYQWLLARALADGVDDYFLMKEVLE
jgi:N-acetylmuramoyl-L-alanine amidase